MQEKYYIIDNAGQYYIVTKLNKQQLDNFTEYVYKNCLTQEGALDLFMTSNWLINRNICHTIILGKIDNAILKSMILKDIDTVLSNVVKHNLLIPNEEIENILMKNDEQKSKIFL